MIGPKWLWQIAIKQKKEKVYSLKQKIQFWLKCKGWGYKLFLRGYYKSYKEEVFQIQVKERGVLGKWEGIKVVTGLRNTIGSVLH